MIPTEQLASAHSLLRVFVAAGIDRVFVVPGESYLGVLDALNDFAEIDVLTCRHEAGAGFMAVADGRLARRPGVVMVSRGPGATNASIAVHTAQQDGVPLILVIGQVVKAHLRRGAFQEIDYQRMFGGIAKWVAEITEPEQIAEAAFKAVRIANAGTPGPVVLVLPEDLQQQAVPQRTWATSQPVATAPTAVELDTLRQAIRTAQRPLIVAGNAYDAPGGRQSLRTFAERWQIPVAVSFRRHDLFDNDHPLYVGDLGLSNSQVQMEAFHSSDLLLALGTRFGDITSQGYTFPVMPRPVQTVVHCHADIDCIGDQFVADMGIACDPVALSTLATPAKDVAPDAERLAWIARLRGIYENEARWPGVPSHAPSLVDFTCVVQTLARLAPANVIVTLDAGRFGAPFYRHFPFKAPQRLLAPISGAMGYGVPAAVAAQLRQPSARVVCVVGDGGFMMTGNEMIAAVQRRLPILFVLSNNDGYGSIRTLQDREYPGRHAGTSLFNPDFTRIAQAFGMTAECVCTPDGIEPALRRGLAASDGPYFIEFRTQLSKLATGVAASGGSDGQVDR